jgi:hypothetical protein
MAKAKKKTLAESIRQRFAPFGGVELELPKRDPMRPPAGGEEGTVPERPMHDHDGQRKYRRCSS